MVKGLDPKKTFNIHPALLSQLGGKFGGRGMYGRHIHEAVKQALDTGEITESGFTMHFITDELDRGPVFFEHRVPLEKGVTAEEIARAVNKAEHEWQPKITNAVVHRLSGPSRSGEERTRSASPDPAGSRGDAVRR